MPGRSRLNNAGSNIQGYAFLAPVILTVGIFTFAAIFFAVFMSFHRINLFKDEMTFVGFDNFTKMLTLSKSYDAFFNTVRFSAVVAPIQTVLALIIASALNSKIKAQNVFRVIFFLPTLTSSAALTMIFMFLFSIPGPFNTILLSLGLIPEALNWTNETRFALNVIMAMNIWSTVPFFMTLYLAALQDVPSALYEAASVDGANAIRRFFHITVPHMRPITTYVFVMSIIGTMQMFDQAYIMSNGSGGPSNATLTMALLIYQDAFGMQNAMGRASAMAILLAAVIFVFSMLANRLNSKEKLYS